MRTGSDKSHVYRPTNFNRVRNKKRKLVSLAKAKLLGATLHADYKYIAYLQERGFIYLF